MEDKFNYDDFEEFLQDQVRNHRMYPADAVWREIDKKLHGEKRWPALTIAATVLVSATVLICVYFTPKPNIFSIQPAHVNTSTLEASAKNNILNNLTASAPFAKEKTTSPGLIPNSFPDLIPSEQRVSDDGLKEPVTTVRERDLVTANSNPVIPIRIKSQAASKLSIPVNTTPAAEIAEQEISTTTTVNKEMVQNTNSGLTSNSKEVTANKTNAPTTGGNKDYNHKNMVDNFLKDHENEIPLHTTTKKISLKNKFSYLIYFAPSVSYRKLYEDNTLTKENNGGPVGLNYVTDVNKVVRHKPGTGIEAGFSILYHLSDKVRVKSGFQFNMRQYSISAYRANTEWASIALVGSNGIDTIKSLAIYRNNNGYYSAQLVNRYYQLSVPAGIEWEIIGNKRVQLNVAGTIQPTYLLNRNAYLLSTNFKNYTENPDMVRKWNINSNIEAFISFKVGDFKWQLGPQLRYQPYSTFIREYPIKEHLMDYGVKLGLSKTIN